MGVTDFKWGDGRHCSPSWRRPCVVKTKTWLKLRDFKIRVFCRKLSIKCRDHFWVNFFEIPGIFPTCFDCFLHANTATKIRWIIENLLNHFFAIFKVPRPRRDLKPSRPANMCLETEKKSPGSIIENSASTMLDVSHEENDVFQQNVNAKETYEGDQKTVELAGVTFPTPFLFQNCWIRVQ